MIDDDSARLDAHTKRLDDLEGRLSWVEAVTGITDEADRLDAAVAHFEALVKACRRR